MKIIFYLFLICLTFLASCIKNQIDLSSPEKTYETCSQAFLNNKLDQLSKCFYKKEDLKTIEELKCIGFKYPLLTKIINEEIVGKKIINDAEIILTIRSVLQNVEHERYYISMNLITFKKLGQDWRIDSQKNIQMNKAKKVGNKYIPFFDNQSDQFENTAAPDAQKDARP